MKKFNICIVGAGSRYTPDILAMLSNQKERFPLRKIVLYDCESERQDKVGKYAAILIKEYYPEVEELVVTTDPSVAFQNIDFALMQIRAGRMVMRESDEKIALKHGCVGQETCGPGGFAYGMRSIPAVMNLIHDIRKYSPEAWILNYSNPAAIVAEACKRIFPNDHRIINICDMPISIMDHYARALDMSRQDFEPRYFGLNHFGWFTQILDKKTGEDYLPKLKEILSKPRENYDHTSSWAQTFTFMRTMIRDFDEYLPNTYLQYYLYPDKMVEKSNPDYTRANEVLDGPETSVFEMIDKIVEINSIKHSEFAIKPTNGVHASYIVDLATAIANHTNEIFLIITKNDGIISNLDQGMMLEVPCRVGMHGVEPLAIGEIPTFYKGLLENQYAYEKLCVDANLEGSYKKAFQALVINRCVNNADKAMELLDDYIQANKGFWPELK